MEARSNAVRESPPNSKYCSGVYFYPYALDLFRGGQITFRAAMLLAAVDHHLNPWWIERAPSQFNGLGNSREAPEFVQASMDHLRRILQCDDGKTARAVLDQLKSIRPEVFKARKIKRGVWQMRTQRGRGSCNNGIYVKPDILDLWQSGRLHTEKISGWAVLVLAGVDSFERAGKKCFVSNQTIGAWCGLGIKSAELIVRQLKSAGLLDAIYVTKRGKTQRFLRVNLGSRPPIYLYEEEEGYDLF